MLQTGFILRTSNEFQQAIQGNYHVEVWQKGMLFDQGGPVHCFNSAFVTVNGKKFSRVSCEFIVR